MTLLVLHESNKLKVEIDSLKKEILKLTNSDMWITNIRL